jgi:hypothetical protein
MAQQESAPVESWRDVIRRKNTHLLFSEDLGPPGTKVDVEIVNSGKTIVTGQDGETSEKVWLEFRGKKKKLAIGATIAKVLDSMFGTDNHYAWRGWVTLVVLRIKVQDKATKSRLEQNAIRIAADPPRGKSSSSQQRDTKPAEPPAPAEEPGFDPADIQDEDK